MILDAQRVPRDNIVSQLKDSVKERINRVSDAETEDQKTGLYLVTTQLKIPIGKASIEQHLQYVIDTVPMVYNHILNKTVKQHKFESRQKLHPLMLSFIDYSGSRENQHNFSQLPHVHSILVVHPAYDTAFDAFAPAHLHGNPDARQAWAVDQVTKVAKASEHLGLKGAVGFTGSLAFPYLYPWPQRPAGLIDEAFGELARRWRPLLDVYETAGVNFGFEIHPGEDVFDGSTFERFLDALDDHPRCMITYDPSHFLLQQLDYLAFIDIYHDRISAFHVKDAEFSATGRQGVYSGYADWTERAGRFRSLGDGQVDFKGIFSKLTQYGFDGWAVLEWECCLKHPEQGAAEGAPFIADQLIRRTDKAFDDFAGGSSDKDALRKMMGF